MSHLAISMESRGQYVGHLPLGASAPMQRHGQLDGGAAVSFRRDATAQRTPASTGAARELGNHMRLQVSDSTTDSEGEKCIAASGLA